MIPVPITFLIGILAKVGTSVVSNIQGRIENHIIDAALEVFKEQQQSQFSAFESSMRILQEKQDETKALLISQIEAYYDDGIASLRRANTATDNDQKVHFLYTAIERFTTASHIKKVGEAAAMAALF